MASANDYNAAHWAKKVPQYLNQAWSSQPSPFAQLVAEYVKPTSVILELGTGAAQDAIINEINRVLRPGGIVACMVNTTSDPEYQAAKVDDSGLLIVDGLTKRFFTPEIFSTFVSNFAPLLIDAEGKTPKDDAVSNSGMIRFIGRKV